MLVAIIILIAILIVVQQFCIWSIQNDNWVLHNEVQRLSRDLDDLARSKTRSKNFT